MATPITNLDPTLRELEELNSEVQILTKQLGRRKKERNELALSLLETKRLSLRQIARHAGITPARIVQLRKRRNNDH